MERRPALEDYLAVKEDSAPVGEGYGAKLRVSIPSDPTGDARFGQGYADWMRQYAHYGDRPDEIALAVLEWVVNVKDYAHNDDPSRIITVQHQHVGNSFFVYISGERTFDPDFVERLWSGELPRRPHRGLLQKRGMGTEMIKRIADGIYVDRDMKGVLFRFRLDRTDALDYAA